MEGRFWRDRVDMTSLEELEMRTSLSKKIREAISKKAMESTSMRRVSYR